MSNLKHSLYKACIVILILLWGTIPIFSQSTNASDSAKLAALNSLSPEQLEVMLNLMIRSLPADTREGLEKLLSPLKSQTPEIVTVDLKNKKVALIPLAHVCTAVFFNKVKDTVAKYKADGYVVYYEEVRIDTTKNMDTARLKLRKLIGVEPTRQTYAILKKIIPNVIEQPAYKDLGITETDKNADINVEQLVKQYEKLYGTIHLTECDFNTKFGTLIYPCEKLKNNPSPVTLDYRNRHVADLIASSDDKKILVLYGANHIPGIVSLIRK